MLRYIQSHNVLSVKDDDPPCVVHCSAGIGRSGTFILVDGVLRMVCLQISLSLPSTHSILFQIELGIPESEISLNDLLVDLRCQRFGLIQTPQQLMFSWHAIVDALQQMKNAKSQNGTDTAVSADLPSPVDRKAKRKTDDTETESTDDRLAKRWVLTLCKIMAMRLGILNTKHMMIT
ncbi:unnamed protein product [Cylicostephanus goldi]|uniref:protein-tyrosine-phosphatase n=1 Tax=Cylicostephanus goldi TaxID=71465 RepID=A0A3P6THU1_CYLGO|nr:unnamed protein product [Cylicostephanus goldi]